MSRFEVVIRGRDHWIHLDDELLRVGFSVTRVVDASDADEAARKALELVRNDAKARPAPGHPPPALTVDEVRPSAADLHPQPGFAFYPETDWP